MNKIANSSTNDPGRQLKSLLVQLEAALMSAEVAKTLDFWRGNENACELTIHRDTIMSIKWNGQNMYLSCYELYFQCTSRLQSSATALYGYK